MNNKYLFLFLSCFLLVFATTYAQDTQQGSGQDMDLEQDANMPDGIDPSTINPADVTPDNLKKAGYTDAEIEQIMKAKKEKLSEKEKESEESENKEDTEEIENESEEDKKLKNQKGNKYPEPAIYGQGFFRNNTIGFYNKASNIKAPDNYILGAGDEISINIWGYSDYDNTFIINESGAIQPNLVGRIYLKGLTFKNAKSLLIRRFGQVYDLNNSKIDITLTYSRVITVNIVGEVFNPGSYTIPAINSAFNALVAVDGPSQIGSVRKIFLKRGGETIKHLDLYKFLMDPQSDQEYFMQDNDYIFIPPAGRTVKIRGEVKRPHTYELIENENLKALLEYAGGFKPEAYTSRVQVKRFLKQEMVLIDINVDSLIQNNEDFNLYAGDEVLVREIPSNLQNYVEIKGAVKLPGYYELKKGTRLTDIIKMAEGVLSDALLGRGYIARLQKDLSRKYIPINIGDALRDSSSEFNVHIQEYDIIRIFSQANFRDDYFIEVFGTVNDPGKFVYGEGMNLKDALYLAGGLKPEAANNRVEISRVMGFNEAKNNSFPTRTIVKTVEVNYDLTLDDSADEIRLEPHDQIIVRKTPEFEMQRNVILKGEVEYPGVYPLLDKEETILEVINRAGGFTDWAHIDAAKIYRKKDGAGHLFLDLKKVLKKPSTRFNYVLKEGDVITIPEINELVTIKGAVEYPGMDTIRRINAPYHKGKRAGFYIREYGLGFRKEAKKGKTFAKQPGGFVDGTTNLGIIKIYPKVEKGGVITVRRKEKDPEKEKKEREPIDWENIFQSTTTKLSGLATLYILYLTIEARSK